MKASQYLLSIILMESLLACKKNEMQFMEKKYEKVQVIDYMTKEPIANRSIRSYILETSGTWQTGIHYFLSSDKLYTTDENGFVEFESDPIRLLDDGGFDYWNPFMEVGMGGTLQLIANIYKKRYLFRPAKINFELRSLSPSGRKLEMLLQSEIYAPPIDSVFDVYYKNFMGFAVEVTDSYKETFKAVGGMENIITLRLGAPGEELLIDTIIRVNPSVNSEESILVTY